MEYLIDLFKKETGIDIRNDRQALQRLKEAAEKAKIELSSVMETEINLPYLTADASGPKHLVTRLTRSRLEQLTEDLIARSLGPCELALKDAGITKDDIDEVVLVGGMTRMPAIQEAVRRAFGKEPNRSVNPDEVVAIGAAVQAGVLGGEVRDVLLLDVTPLTLSIETLGGVATPLIERNTTIPTRKSQIFSTASDNQTSVEIHIVQGERPMAADNKSLGKFILDGIPPAPRGVPQIEVSFDIDANGILNVTATDKATGKSAHITIQPSSGLSKDEIERMVREAQTYAAQDKARRERVEAHNEGDTAAYQAEKFLRENGDKIPADKKAELEAKIAAVRQAIMGEDAAAMRSATADLKQVFSQIGAAMYQQASTTGGQASTKDANTSDGTQPPSDGDVVEGEFRETR
jgi:molecular chaperone DnaK